MYFKEGHLYHVYNQGNNKVNIFFTQSNYFLFLQKMKIHILPFADIIAWCLMPNHFHIMLKVNKLKPENSKIDLNKSIGVLLRSYTRSINIQEKFSGSLFRQKTKAECLTCLDGNTPNFYIVEGVTHINNKNIEDQYPQICFNYIHRNPVKAGLCSQIIDWEYSSAKDYFGDRNGKLINKTVAKEHVNIDLQDNN